MLTSLYFICIHMYLSFAAQAFQTQNNSYKNHNHLCISQYSFLQRKIYILVKGRVSQSAVFLCKFTRKTKLIAVVHKVNANGAMTKYMSRWAKAEQGKGQKGSMQHYPEPWEWKPFLPIDNPPCLPKKKNREFCTQSACFSSEKCCIIGDPDFLISIALHNS